MQLFSKAVAAIALSLSSAAILANPHLSPYGATDGGASHHGAMNLSGNPAAPASIRWEYDSESATNSSTFNSGFAFGLVRAGGALNYGQVDDIFDETDRIYDTLDNNESITNAELGDLSQDVESVLGLLEDKGYVNANAYLSLLPLEIASQKMGGVWTLHPHLDFNSNANFSGSSVQCRSSLDPVLNGVEQFYDCDDYLNGTASNDASSMSECSKYVIELLDASAGNQPSIDDCLNEKFGTTDPLRISTDNLDQCETALANYAINSESDTTTIQSECNFDLDSDAAMHLKLGLFTGVGVGYSTKVHETKSGDVFLGIRVKVVSGNLYATKITYSEIVDEYDNDAEKVIADIQDDYSDNATSSSGAALDLGLLWTGRHARVGLSMDNAMAPQFDYIDENGDSQKYELAQQTRFEASIYPENRWIHLTYVQELAEAEAFSGEITQWRNISVGISPTHWALPDIRFGQSEEMVSGLSYLSGGISLFSVVNVDIGISTDTVELDGEDIPRGLYGGFSVEFIF